MPDSISASHPQALLTSLLRDVSRSFYLTLRVLPRQVRPQIGLAYLLARATDTIADTDVLPVASRLEALADLRQRILADGGGHPLDLGRLAGQQALPAERVLLERVHDALAVLARFSPDDRQRIRDVLKVITGGQELDLRRFERAGPDQVVALATGAELDDYTYRVAGCVGEFWTRMCVAHLFPTPADPKGREAPADWFEKCGVRFGQGLQLVNILRDLPRDLQQGRCYLPADELGAAGLRPGDLLQPANDLRARVVYDRWLRRAEEHLAAGWHYTCALPRNFRRLRLACAWPLLIGIRTVALLRSGPVLDSARRIRVSRAEVRQILVRSICSLPFRNRWEQLFERSRGSSGAQPS